jgi:hypothetical protein
VNEGKREWKKNKYRQNEINKEKMKEENNE